MIQFLIDAKVPFLAAFTVTLWGVFTIANVLEARREKRRRNGRS